MIIGTTIEEVEVKTVNLVLLDRRSQAEEVKQVNEGSQAQ